MGRRRGDVDERLVGCPVRDGEGNGSGMGPNRACASEPACYPPNVRAPRGAWLADALVGFLSASNGSATPCLVVHADISVLETVSEPNVAALAETESGVTLADETVRRLACDAAVELVVESNGVPVGIGRRSRTIPPWLARLLRHRDGGQCRFPGCVHRRWLKAHHIRHWALGGRTDLENLMLLCHAHHRLIHEGGWSVRG